MFNFLKRKGAQTVTFDEQLRVLANCGISLSENVTSDGCVIISLIMDLELSGNPGNVARV